MWIYDRKNRTLSKGTTVYSDCHAGNEEGLDNPAMESIHDVGPLPSNLYNMIAIVDSPRTGTRTIVLNSKTHPYGRDGFRIHGGKLSHGCILCGHNADRQAIWDTGDHLVSVI